MFWWGFMLTMKYCLVFLCVWGAKMKLILFRKRLSPKRLRGT